MEGVTGKKKLRIQKYPDTCGRDEAIIGYCQDVHLKIHQGADELLILNFHLLLFSNISYILHLNLRFVNE